MAEAKNNDQFISGKTQALSELDFDADPRKSTVSGELLRGLLPLVLVGLSLWGYRTFGVKSPPPTKPPAGPKQEEVNTAEIKSFTDPMEIRVEGIAKPYRYIKVAAEVAGRVKYKSPRCQEATFVKQGELLLEIDPVDYEIAEREIANQLKQSEHAIEEWQVDKKNTLEQIEIAKSDLALARREVERVRQLESNRVATASEIDSARKIEVASQSQLLLQQNRLRMLDAQYERTLAAKDLQAVKLEKARRDLAKTKIYAPCNATVVSEDVEQDGYVQPGATVVVLNDTSITEVQCNLELEDMYWLWGSSKGKTEPGKDASSDTNNDAQLAKEKAEALDMGVDSAYSFPETPVTVEFKLPDNQVCVWEGKMVRFSGSGLDLATRTIPCQVMVENPREGKLVAAPGGAPSVMQPPPLTVGMFVSVIARVKPAIPLVQIPNDALKPGDTVWLIDQGKLHIHKVRVARRNLDSLLVHADPTVMTPGRSVIVSPLALAQEGLLVKERALKP